MTRAPVIVLLALLAAGCAPTTTGRPAVPSMAVSSTQDTALGRELEPMAAEHSGASGFRLLNEGREAFAVRTALAEVAERSIDVQYFLWDGDAVGTILLNRLMRAANRGVRVRLLVDDLYIKGRDVAIAALDAHPNVEIRLYNVFGGRNPLALGRRLGFLLEFGRLNHRMHNKLFVVDNQIAVMGGRNIADAYFGVDPKLNYRDMAWWRPGRSCAGSPPASTRTGTAGRSRRSDRFGDLRRPSKSTGPTSASRPGPHDCSRPFPILSRPMRHGSSSGRGR
jgi:cardiolipin synthase C